MLLDFLGLWKNMHQLIQFKFNIFTNLPMERYCMTKIARYNVGDKFDWHCN